MRKNDLAIRVYYEDTDCGNVVYYANYLRFMERGRTELLRDMGIELADYHAQDTLFAVVEASVRYKSSARYNDLLTITTTVKEFSAASITFHCDILRDKTLLATGDVRVACIKTSSGIPRRIPRDIVSALLAAR